MATWFNLLCAALLLGLCPQGSAVGPCNLSHIRVRQSRTDKVVEGQPEYEVVISNLCHCPQKNVKLRCATGGLSTVEALDPTVLRDVGDGKCLVNGGHPIVQGSSVRFTYAWLTPSDLPPAESQIDKTDRFPASLIPTLYTFCTNLTWNGKTDEIGIGLRFSILCEAGRVREAHGSVLRRRRRKDSKVRYFDYLPLFLPPLVLLHWDLKIEYEN
ncbi:hypothetical protein H6P81_011986 [Aristolochia fimbriata]|uniref:Uncharacterized protein n=1 Tax=Aristolochia fimbriata TaxID=158543 RepID=A0AAV7EAW0_ARIFI|nr:hypothetical protein H6P81_011986 [Aristolochia fimbriata]